MEDKDYISNVYSALKDNLQGFDKSEEDFRKEIQNKDYADRVYKALGDNLHGFNKKPDEFYSNIGLKKKENSAGRSTGNIEQKSQSVVQSNGNDGINFQQYNPEVLKQPIADSDQKRYQLLQGYNQSHSNAMQGIDKEIQKQQANPQAVEQLNSLKQQIGENNQLVQKDLQVYHDKALGVMGALKDISNLTDVTQGKPSTIQPPEVKQPGEQLPQREEGSLEHYLESFQGGVQAGLVNILKTADGASKAISDATGGFLSHSGEFKEMADKLEGQKKELLPAEGIGQKSVEAVGEMVPFMLQMATAGLNVSSLGKIAAHLSPIVSTMAANGFFKAYGETGNVRESAKQGAIGAGEGVIMSALGYPAKLAGEAIGNKILSAVAKTAVAGTTFGGYEAGRELATTGKLNTEDIGVNFAMGAGMEGAGFLSSALSNYVSADKKTIEAAVKSQKSIEQLRKDAVNYADKAQSEENKEDKDSNSAAALATNGIADVKAVHEMITKDPAGFIKSVQGSELPEETKKELIKKANDAVLGSDAKVAKIQGIDESIKAIEEAEGLGSSVKEKLIADLENKKVEIGKEKPEEKQVEQPKKEIPKKEIDLEASQKEYNGRKEEIDKFDTREDFINSLEKVPCL